MGAESMVINSIKRGVISPVYLFYGPETFLINQTLDSLYQALVPEGIGDFNFEKLDGSLVSPAQVVDSAGTLPAFADKRLVIVRNAAWFGGGKSKGSKGEEDKVRDEIGEEEPLLRYFQNPSPYSCLVLVAGEKIDLRRKIVKAAQKAGQVLEFASLRGMELNRWIEDRFQAGGKKAERGAAEFLSAAVGSSLSSLAAEIEKIILYAGDSKKIILNDVQSLVSQSTTLSVFDLMDAVGTRDAAAAVQKLREIIKAGEAEAKILALLARHLRTMLQVKTLATKGYRENELGGELGIHPYAAKKGLQQSRNFSAKELADNLEILLEADLAIKTGRGEAEGIMETAVLKMCRRQQEQKE